VNAIPARPCRCRSESRPGLPAPLLVPGEARLHQEHAPRCDRRPAIDESRTPADRTPIRDRDSSQIRRYLSLFSEGMHLSWPIRRPWHGHGIIWCSGCKRSAPIAMHRDQQGVYRVFRSQVQATNRSTKFCLFRHWNDRLVLWTDPHCSDLGLAG